MDTKLENLSFKDKNLYVFYQVGGIFYCNFGQGQFRCFMEGAGEKI